MTVLVTGGAGYVGAHVAFALVDAGREVVVLDDMSTGFPDAPPPEAVVVTGDAGDAALARRLIADHGITAIMHFAAKTVAPQSVIDPWPFYETNLLKTAALANAAAETGVRAFVYSSTAAVYGEAGMAPVVETATLSPASPYGQAKLAAERMLQDMGRAYGFALAILRYFNVAGADPAGRAGQSTPDATHLIKVACQAALGLRPRLVVYGDDFPTPDGTGVRDYIQVSDLAAAHVAALDHLEAGGESLTLNCGYGVGVSVRQVVEAVRRVSGVEIPVVVEPRRPGDPASVVADAGRLRERLGWSPRHDDLDAMVSQALAWERKLAAKA